MPELVGAVSSRWKVRRHRRQEPLPQPRVDEHAHREVADEADDERGRGSPPHDADGGGNAECEECVAEHNGALGVEDALIHPAVDPDDRRTPPRDEQREHERGCERNGDREAELAGEPACPRDALRPGEAMRALLELEDERSGEQHADDPGNERQPRDEAVERIEPRVERRECARAAPDRAAGRGTRRSRPGRTPMPFRCPSARAGQRAARAERP